MFDHPMIDVGIALIFFYVVLSLIASAVQEWIASLFGLRAKTLRAGIRNMIGSQYTEKVYNHPLIKKLSKESRFPSYIASQTLSNVLLEVIARESRDPKPYVVHTGDEIRALVDKIDQNHPLKEILGALIDDSEDVAASLRNRLSGWFDEGMSRVAGWYVRQAKAIILVIAGTVTVATNASSIHLAEELWRNDALRVQVAAQAQEAAQSSDSSQLESRELDSLKAFPIGWKEIPNGVVGWLRTLLGWIITTAAISLGAPFWFDLLSKVANLRGSGRQPKDSQMA